jgi:hypothetical protein
MNALRQTTSRRRARAFGTGTYALVVTAALFAVPPARAEAQGMRGSAGSTTRYVELRPLRQDTIPRALVTARPDGTFLYEGLPASCDDTRCIIYRAGEVEHALLATHDADVTVWGFGVTGLSASFLLRGRSRLGGDFELPRSDERFEAVLGYAELVRGNYRVRAGRQRELSGLGFSGFDGLEVLVEPRAALRFRGYGGRSLARAVQQPVARAFRAAEERDFILDRDAFLVGGEAAWDSPSGTMVALRYQGEIWDDRAGLLSERALLTGRTLALAPFVLAGLVEYDVGYGRLGKAHIDVHVPLPIAGVRAEAMARRYVPFFEYWTIWGLFSPVAYHEGELRVSWAGTAGLGLWGAGAYRRYEPHNTQTFLRPLEDRAVRAAAGAEWRLPQRLRFDAALRMEGPAGAFAFSGDAALHWRASPRLDVSLHGVVLEQLEEFRLGAGVVAGGGLAADLLLRDDLRVMGGVELYRQTQPGRPLGVDWTQRRGWLSVRLDLGRDPGLRPEDGP